MSGYLLTNNGEFSGFSENPEDLVKFVSEVLSNTSNDKKKKALSMFKTYRVIDGKSFPEDSKQYSQYFHLSKGGAKFTNLKDVTDVLLKDLI